MLSDWQCTLKLADQTIDQLLLRQSSPSQIPIDSTIQTDLLLDRHQIKEDLESLTLRYVQLQESHLHLED